MRLSLNGMRAERLGLATLETIASEIHCKPELLSTLPKAEWHHDTSTGKKVWMYDRRRVASFIHSRKFKAPHKTRRRARDIFQLS